MLCFGSMNFHPNWLSYFSEGWLSHQPVHDDFENGIRISPFFTIIVINEVQPNSPQIERMMGPWCFPQPFGSQPRLVLSMHHVCCALHICMCYIYNIFAATWTFARSWLSAFLKDKVDVITPFNILVIAGGKYWSLMKMKLLFFSQSTYCSEEVANFDPSWR